MSTNEWYYLDAERKRVGPLSVAGLAQLWTEGVLDGESMVWNSCLPNWTRIADHEDLKTFFRRIGESASDAAKTSIIRVFESSWGQVATMSRSNDQWQELQTPEGRTYYWNPQTNATAWTKPTELNSQVGLEAVVPDQEELLPNYADYAAEIAARKAGIVEEELEEGDLDKTSAELEKEFEAKAAKEKHSSLQKPETSQVNNNAEEVDESKKKKRKQKKKRVNTSIYVSGVPSDVTVQEFGDFFSKCGLIKEDLDGTPKVRLYENEHGERKGDGVVTFAKQPSVDLAIKLYDGAEIRPGKKISVMEAKFEKKGDSLPPPEKKKKMSETFGKKVLRKKADMALSWDDEVETGRGLRIVVLKSLFGPGEFEYDLDGTEKREMEKELLLECAKLGDVEKVTVFENNPEGVAVVKFAESIGAKRCIEVMDGRFFAGRKLSCFFWDGITNYKVEESAEKRKRREESFGQWLEDEETKENKLSN